MRELISQDIEYQKQELYKWDALQLLDSLGMHDKAELLRYRSKSTVNIYYLGKHPNYFYGFMPHSTGDTPLFDLLRYRSGMVLVFPGITSPTAVPDYVPQTKLADVFDEAEEWGRIIASKQRATLMMWWREVIRGSSSWSARCCMRRRSPSSLIRSLPPALAWS